MIEVREVRKVFNEGGANEFVALDGVSLSLAADGVTVLRGPSGSGKTTLLSLVGCMARPTAGRISLDGREVSGLPERFLTAVRRATFGFVFQQLHLVRGIDVLENVMLPAYPLGVPRARLRERALELLARLDLAGRAGARVEWLSGGEAQRVAIARALVNDPPIVIADEPTAHLDTRLSREFMDVVARLKGEGRRFIIASHDPLVFESPVADRVVAMRDGRLEAPGA
ncbi:MAG TPA: ABC transporter ATP-binding protein [bacterium]